MKFKKIILSIFLIGFLFNVFHDFVFYSVDPCLSNIEDTIKFDNGFKNDIFCEIHGELHQNYLSNSNIEITTTPNEEINYSFSYCSYLNQFNSEIFKPPKHLI